MSRTVLLEKVNQYWKWLNEKPKTLSVAVGLLMGSAFLHPFFWWAQIIGLAIAIHIILGSRSAVYAAFLAFFIGSTKIACAFWWLWSVYPAQWAGEFPPFVQLALIGWVWIVASVATGSAFSLFGYLIYRVRVYPYFIVPTFLVFSEVFSSVLFSFFEYGQGSTLSAHMSIGYAGYTLAQHALLGLIALWGGVYTLSFVAGVLALVLRDGMRAYHERPEWTLRTYMTSLIVVIVCLTYAIPVRLTPTPVGLRVATVNTEFPRVNWVSVDEQADMAHSMIEGFQAALIARPDIIVFPETSRALTRFGGSEYVFDYIQSQTDHDVIVVDSDFFTSKTNELIVRARLYDFPTREVYDVEKEYLSPSGEYLPYHLAALLSIFGSEQSLSAAKRVMKFSSGSNDQSLSPEGMPGVLFCSEVLSPLLVFQKSKIIRTHLLVHPVSHAWFHSPRSFWYQQELMLRSHSRMNRVSIVRAANMWAPTAYDSLGQPVAGEVVFSNASTSVVIYEL